MNFRFISDKDIEYQESDSFRIQENKNPSRNI